MKCVRVRVALDTEDARRRLEELREMAESVKRDLDRISKRARRIKAALRAR